MGERDGPTDATAPALDYETPFPAAGRDRADVRFTAGAGLPCLGLFAAGVWGGDDMPICSAIGLAIEIAMIAAVFNGGRRFCRWGRGTPLQERSRAGTFGYGVLVGGLALAMIFVADRAAAHLPQLAPGLATLAVLAAIAASPWWVFRPADGG